MVAQVREEYASVADFIKVSVLERAVRIDPGIRSLQALIGVATPTGEADATRSCRHQQEAGSGHGAREPSVPLEEKCRLLTRVVVQTVCKQPVPARCAECTLLHDRIVTWTLVEPKAVGALQLAATFPQTQVLGSPSDYIMAAQCCLLAPRCRTSPTTLRRASSTGCCGAQSRCPPASLRRRWRSASQTRTPSTLSTLRSCSQSWR